MDCSALPLEILRNGLTHCYYVALHCRHWGDVLAAIKEAPIRFQPYREQCSDGGMECNSSLTLTRIAQA